MRKLRTGVIGTGHMGKNHVRIAATEPCFDVVGIYDPDRAEAEAAAAPYGLTVFESMEELLEQVEAVTIAAPSSMHRELGLIAAEHGVHVLMEKPLATTSEDAHVLVKAFREKNLKLQVGHVERFNPVIPELDKLLKEEKVYFIEAKRYSPFNVSGRITDTGVIEDLMIHDVDLVCHLLEPARVTEIKGVGKSMRSNDVDFASCALIFDTGAYAVINASRVAQDKERTIVVHTPDSCITADLLSRTLTVRRETNLAMGGANVGTYRQNSVIEKIFVPDQEPLRGEHLSFYESVVNGAPVSVPGEFGARAIEICEEVTRQVKASWEKGEKT